MTEEEGDHKFEPPAAQIRLSGIATLLAIAEVITAEERAEPVFRAMDMGRLARVADGNIKNVDGLEGVDPEILRILARHWYDQILREEDRAHTQKSIDLSQKSIDLSEKDIRRSTFAIWFTGISAAAAVASAIAAIAAVS